MPGAADRVIRQFEDEGAHRRKMQDRSLDLNTEGMRRQFWEARLGQICATIMTIVSVGAGSYVSTHGQPWAGAIFGTLGIGAIVTRMILGRNKEPEEAEKDSRKKERTKSRR